MYLKGINNANIRPAYRPKQDLSFYEVLRSAQHEQISYSVANTRRQRALPAQDAVPGRHHARHFRTIGFHCKAGRPGTEAQSQPNPLPRGVRTQQSAPGVGHAGKTGQGQQGQGG